MTLRTPAGRRPVAVLACAALLALIALVPAADSGSRDRSCTRGGATLEAAHGPVRVVRLKRPRERGETRREALLGCWAPTGRRRTILVETDHGDDLRTHTRLEIVDKRWVGTIVRYEGGITESLVAAVHDARTGRPVHRSDACEPARGDRYGVDDAAFLPDGGLAFSCNRLLVFEDRYAKEPRELEPAGTDVRHLAVARFQDSFSPRLYWTVASGDALTHRSLNLGG